MPVEPPKRPERRVTEEELRQRQELRAKRRKKRRMQQALVIGAFALFLVLIIVCIVMIVRAAFGGKKADASSLPPTSVASVPDEPDPVVPSLPAAADPTAWNLVLINKNKPMPDGFSPETVVVSELGHTFDKRAEEDLKQMIAACNAEEGNSLAITSAYRGATTQNGKYTALVDVFKAQGKSQEEAELMAKEIDPPYGQSDHQTALAVDFITGTVQEAAQAFADTPEFAWLMQHAAEYGFVLRFPAEKAAITGITYQPFHFRYVGKEDAAAMRGAGICLEEYLREAASAPDGSESEEQQIG